MKKLKMIWRLLFARRAALITDKETVVKGKVDIDLSSAVVYVTAPEVVTTPLGGKCYRLRIVATDGKGFYVTIYSITDDDKEYACNRAYEVLDYIISERRLP